MSRQWSEWLAHIWCTYISTVAENFSLFGYVYGQWACVARSSRFSTARSIELIVWIQSQFEVNRRVNRPISHKAGLCKSWNCLSSWCAIMKLLITSRKNVGTFFRPVISNFIIALQLDKQFQLLHKSALWEIGLLRLNYLGIYFCIPVRIPFLNMFDGMTFSSIWSTNRRIWTKQENMRAVLPISLFVS